MGFWDRIANGVFGRVQFGGVVGKACLTFAVAIIGSAFALWAAGSNFWVAIGGICIIFVSAFVVCAILFFAYKRPDLALLEGTDWLKHQESLIQAKGTQPLVASAPVEPPALTAAPEPTTHPVADGLIVGEAPGNGAPAGEDG